LFQKLAKADYASTTVTVMLVCGDGFAEPLSGEVCDPGNPPGIPIDVGTTTCSDFFDIFGNPFVSGNLDCLNDCSDYNTNGCYTCGNGYKEEEEECDGSDLGGLTCLSYGHNTGNLSCTATCMINIMGCSSVGLDEPGDEGSQGGSSGGRHGGGSGVANGYNPGSDIPPGEAKVIIRGKSYPNADVHILIDGKIIGIVKADSKADFYFETTDITPGIVGFGIWSEDEKGIKSSLLTLTFRIISGAVTTISGAYLAPSIDVDKQSIKKGEMLKIFGQTIPETKVNVHINSEEEIIKQINSNESGDWILNFDTSSLSIDEFHIAKALFQMEVSDNIIKSGFSRSISFFVGETGIDDICSELI